MRWAPLHPRQIFAVASAAFVMALVLMLAAAPDLATLDFSIGSDAGRPDVSAPIPNAIEAVPSGPPEWVTDPLAPPLRELGLR